MLNSLFYLAKDNAIYVFLTIISLILSFLIHFLYFATRRITDLPEKYMYESTFKLMMHHDDMNDYFLECFKQVKAETGRDTWSSTFLGLPTYLFTNSIENVTHILKTSFNNYGKGPLIKSRFKDFLGDGIFIVDGDQWYHHRKTSANLFNMNIFKTTVMNAFNHHCDHVIDIIKSDSGKTFDFQSLMYKFTLDSIGTIAFGYDIGALKQTRVEFADDFDYAQETINRSFTDPLWYFNRLFTPSGWKYYRSLKRLDKYAYEMIKKRRAEDQINSKQGFDESSKRDLLSLYLEKQEPGQELSDKNLRDIVLNFIIAGRDTTALAISWCMYRFCIHQDQQIKVREEIINEIGNNRWNQLTYDNVQSLKYLDAFCMEVLRLHPSVPRELKYCYADDILPDGTKIYKGDLICFCPWVMGRTESIWKNCYEFDPLRFYNQPKPSPFVFTAFQAGPRMCLGQSFALLEMKLSLARLLAHFEFKLEQDPSTVTYLTTVTLPIKGGLKVSAKEII